MSWSTPTEQAEPDRRPPAPALAVTRPVAVAAVLFVVGSLVFLHRIGGGQLAAPPLTTPGDLGDWLEQRDIVTATFALLRLVGIGAGWYLVAATGLQFAAGITRFRALRTTADFLSTPTIRHVASGLLGLTITVSAAASDNEAAPSGATIERVADPAGSAILRRLPDGEVIVEIPDDAADTATLERLPDGTSDATPPQPAADAWLIECGDHPWSVAEHVLADSWGRAPSDAEIDPYWRELLHLNALPNPDMVTPGQKLLLPPPPQSPG